MIQFFDTLSIILLLFWLHTNKMGNKSVSLSINVQSQAKTDHEVKKQGFEFFRLAIVSISHFIERKSFK